MNEQNIFKKLEELDEKMEALKVEVEEEKERLCSEYHPIKLGGEVVANYGYSNEGKTIIVDRLFVARGTYALKKYCFAAFGHIKKKNGSIGIHRAQWRTPSTNKE